LIFFKVHSPPFATAFQHTSPQEAALPDTSPLVRDHCYFMLHSPATALVPAVPNSSPLVAAVPETAPVRPVQDTSTLVGDVREASPLLADHCYFKDISPVTALSAAKADSFLADGTVVTKISVEVQCDLDQSQRSRLEKETQKIYHKYFQAQNEIRQLKNKIRFMKSSKCLNPNIQKKLIENGMTENMSSMFTKKVKFTKKILRKDIVVATVIRSISPKVFRYIRKQKIVRLPSESTVRKWLKNFKLTEGIQIHLLELIKKQSSEKTDFECFLSFDEMALKKRWVYDKAGIT